MNSSDDKRIVTITLTQKCNLSCIYCYETHKSNRCMDFVTARRIIDYEISKLNPTTTLEIDFFGGEPLLEFKLIQSVVDYVQKTYYYRKIIFFIITNGTLLNSEIKNWLHQHKDSVICGLSFDGTKYMQDINRSNSFDLVDLGFFVTEYPTQTVKMTISPETLDKLSEGVIFLQSKGFDVTCNLAYGIDWKSGKFSTILERELEKLIMYYLERPDIPICSMLDMGIEGVAIHQDKMSRYCGAGIDMVSYDIDGTAYPCQMFMPLSAGEEKASHAKEIHFFEDIIPNEYLDQKCIDCVIKSICPTCYGSNYINSGNIYLHDDSYCHLMKIIMKARSYLKGQLWACGRLKLTPPEEAVLLKSISILQTSL